MENLRQLMAAYFHQDWWDEYGGAWEAAVDDFARREPDRIAGVTTEISALVASVNSDEALAKTLDALGNCRDPGDTQDAHIAWLSQIRERLEQLAATQ